MEPGFEELSSTAVKGRDSTFKGVSGHRIACDDQGDGIYVVGGWNPGFTAPNSGNQTDRHYVREVWKFNIATRTWTELRSHDPPISLASHCLVNSGRTVRGGPSRLLVFGGSLSAIGFSGNSNETFIFHVGDERWERLGTTGKPPSRVNGHWFGQAMAKRGNHIYVASGRFIFPNSSIDRVELHRLNLETLVWDELSADVSEAPSYRVRHEIVVDDNERIYVLGGAIDFAGESFDLENIPYFDVASRRWHQLVTVPDSNAGFPKRRSCFGAVIRGDYVFVVGGHFRDVWNGENDAAEEILDDLWRLHLPSGRWAKYSITLPRPLWFHAVDIDREGVLYVFGGCTTDDYYGERTNQLWSVSLSVPTLKRLAWDKVLKCISESADRGDIYSKLGLPSSFVVPKVTWFHKVSQRHSFDLAYRSRTLTFGSGNRNMFCAIYEFCLKDHVTGEELYKIWRTMAQFMKENAGAIGSRLHRDDADYRRYIAYSQWRDRDQWAQGRKLLLESENGLQMMEKLGNLCESKVICESSHVDDLLTGNCCG